MASMSGVTWSGVTRLVVALGLAAAGASCGDVVRQSRAPVLLVIDLLQGSAGNTTPGPFGNPLVSDVLTNVTSPAPCTPQTPCQTVFNDLGQVVLRLVPKDVINTTSPSSNNAITITRYRVVYRRTDGRSTQGVDVPYAFDGGITGTVPPEGTVTLGFELVRHTAKEESPLVQLIDNPTIIATIAEITFFGQDQVGNDISVTGTLQVNFGNFGI
jgi:hypothetical protein